MPEFPVKLTDDQYNAIPTADVDSLNFPEPVTWMIETIDGRYDLFFHPDKFNTDGRNTSYLRVYDPATGTVCDIEYDNLFGYTVIAKIPPSRERGSGVMVYRQTDDHATATGNTLVEQVNNAVNEALAPRVTQRFIQPSTQMPYTMDNCGWYRSVPGTPVALDFIRLI